MLSQDKPAALVSYEHLGVRLCLYAKQELKKKQQQQQQQKAARLYA